MIKAALGIFFIMLLLNLAHWILSALSPEYKAASLWFRVFSSAFIFAVGGAAASILVAPNSTALVQIFLFLPPSFVLGMMALHTVEEQDKDLLIDQIKQYQDVKHVYTFLYFGVSTFFTPFEPKWILVFVSSSLQFMGAMTLVGVKEPGKVLDAAAFLDIIFKTLMYCGLMASMTYFIRYLTTMTFMFQIQAENSRDTINTIFDNIPDSVLLVSEVQKGIQIYHPDNIKHAEVLGKEEANKLKMGDVGAKRLELNYCNQQADRMFNSNLSQAASADLKLGQYLMVQNRCLVELKKKSKFNTNETTQELMTDQQNNLTQENLLSLETFESGLGILTLEEALQTFSEESESALFRIQLRDQQQHDTPAKSSLHQTYDNEISESNQTSNGKIIRIRKHRATFNGEEKIIILIRDFSDSIQFEKNLITQKEDNGRINLIQQELNQVFSTHVTTLDKLIHSGENTENEPVYAELKDSSQDLYLLFCQFRDLVSIRTGQFKTLRNQFKPIAFFNDMKTQIMRMGNIKFLFDLKEDTMPFTVFGDKFRFNYLIRKLIQNSIERCFVTLVYHITVKFYMEDQNANQIVDLLEDANSDGMQRFIVCEITDQGKHLTGKQIRNLLTPPSQNQISNPDTELPFNLANLKVIATNLKARLSVFSDQKGTSFTFALPVTIMDDQGETASGEMLGMEFDKKIYNAQSNVRSSETSFPQFQ